MNFEEAITLIEEQNILHVKVQDFNKNRILTIGESTPIEVQKKLESYKNALSAYGKVTFICATEKIYNSSWRDAAHWSVTFSGMNMQQQQPLQGINTGLIPNGYVSQTEATLRAEFEALKMRMDYDKKVLELESKIGKKVDTPDQFLKYLPMLGFFMDIDPKKLEAVTSLGNLVSAMNGTAQAPPVQQQQGQGMNGMGSLKDNPEIVSTPEEEAILDDIEEQIVGLSGKVQLTSIRDFMKVLNEKPELITTLEALMENFKK